MSWFDRRPEPVRRPVPEWPDAQVGTRVLVEHPDPTVRDVLERGLAARGIEVLTCAGPGPDGPDATSCPLLHQQRCPAVEGADVIASGLPLTRHVTRMILRHIAEGGHPLIVEAPSQVLDERGAGITDLRLFPMDAGSLADTVEQLQSATRPG